MKLPIALRRVLLAAFALALILTGCNAAQIAQSDAVVATVVTDAQQLVIDAPAVVSLINQIKPGAIKDGYMASLQQVGNDAVALAGLYAEVKTFLTVYTGSAN